MKPANRSLIGFAVILVASITLLLAWFTVALCAVSPTLHWIA